jgi:OOP family OmpA-OmpF porin
VLEGVNFEFDSARLTSPAKSILDRVAMSLAQWPEIRVEVAGHTDSIGPNAYNMRLSQSRAESVRAYLMERGIAADRMAAKGYGEDVPIADNSTKDGRSKNRRVELRKLN